MFPENGNKFIFDSPHAYGAIFKRRDKILNYTAVPYGYRQTTIVKLFKTTVVSSYAVVFTRRRVVNLWYIFLVTLLFLMLTKFFTVDILNLFTNLKNFYLIISLL